MEKIVLTPNEAAELIRISPNDIYSLITSGDIPAYREGRNWKIPKTLLVRYVEERALREAEERRK